MRPAAPIAVVAAIFFSWRLYNTILRERQWIFQTELIRICNIHCYRPPFCHWYDEMLEGKPSKSRGQAAFHMLWLSIILVYHNYNVRSIKNTSKLCKWYFWKCTNYARHWFGGHWFGINFSKSSIILPKSRSTTSYTSTSGLFSFKNSGSNTCQW